MLCDYLFINTTGKLIYITESGKVFEVLGFRDNTFHLALIS